MCTVFSYQDNASEENKVTSLGSITVNRNPLLDECFSNKKSFDDELDKNKIFRFIQTLQNYLKVSIGKIVQVWQKTINRYKY